MADMKLYWARVRAIEAQLPVGPVWITSLTNDNKGTHAGVVVECDQNLGAQRIADGTHRVATQEEVNAHSAAQAERKKKTDAREARRRASTASTLILSPEHLAQLGLQNAKGKKAEQETAA